MHIRAIRRNPMKEKKTAQISAKLQQSTYDRLHRFAQMKDRSMSYIIEYALRRLFKMQD